MTSTHDILILGGGPAGSTAALVAAKAGLDVVVLDKSTFPRPKICGDCINPRSWDIWERLGLGESFSRLPHHKPTHIGLSHDFHRPLEFPFHGAGGGQRAVSREVLDNWLKEEAVAAGAVFHTGTLPLSFLPDHTLSTNKGDFKGRALIGADGRNSWLARAAGLNRPGRRCRRIAWQTSLPAHFSGPGVHMTFFPEGYFGLARNGADKANLCMVLKEGSETTAQQVAERYFPGCGPLVWRSTSPITRPDARPAAGNILLAGDAARVVEPFTGEGIYLALASGELAGTLAVDALRNNSLDQLADRYSHSHRRLYERLSWQNRLTRWLGAHPTVGRYAVAFLHRIPEAAKALCRPFL